MEEWIKLLSETVSSGAFLIFAPIGYFVYKTVDNHLISAFRKMVIDRFLNRLVDLSTHPLLYSKHKYITYINNLNLGDSQRHFIFKIILESMLEEITKKAISLSKKKKSELEKLDIYLGTENVIIAYEKAIKEKLKKKYTGKTDGKSDCELIYKIVYEDNVREYNKKSLQVVFSMIQSNEASKLSIDAKYYTLFNTILAMLDFTFLSIEKTFAELNGSLSKIIDKYD